MRGWGGGGGAWRAGVLLFHNGYYASVILCFLLVPLEGYNLCLWFVLCTAFVSFLLLLLLFMNDGLNQIESNRGIWGNMDRWGIWTPLTRIENIVYKCHVIKHYVNMPMQNMDSCTVTIQHYQSSINHKNCFILPLEFMFESQNAKINHI